MSIIDWIRDNRDDLVIISASRVAGKLEKLGINSDIIVTVDPQEHSFEVNEAMMALSQKSLLVSAYHTCSDIIAQWNGNMLYLGTNAPWESQASNIPPEGPTVTNAAIHLAIEMGFTQILLCGVDYCYSQTGKTHTGDTYAASFGPDIGTIHEWVETYSGEMAETPMQLLLSIEALVETTKQWPDVQFINLSPNSARVEGVSYCKTNKISLMSIALEHKKTLAPEKFNLPAAEKLKRIIVLEKQVDDALQNIGKIIKLLQSALSLCKKIARTKKVPLIQQLSTKLNNIESELNAKFSNFIYIIKFYGLYEFSHFLSTKESDSWTQEDVIEQNNIYYMTFLDIAKELNNLLLDSKKRLKSRVAEHTSPIKLDAFITQWVEDKHFGRAAIWLHEHPEMAHDLTENERETFAQLLLEYHALFNKKTHEGLITSKVKNIEGAYRKLSILMQQKHLIGISKMVQYISPFKEQDSQISHLFYLAMSYQLFLENNFEGSLDCILKLEKSNINENELRHIITLALRLDKYPLAEEALAQLIKYNDSYIPQYANIFYLQNKPQLALNAYLDYLDKYPEDIPILLKFGSFLLNINQIDSAKSIFNQVLSLEDNNLVALNHLQKLG